MTILLAFPSSAMSFFLIFVILELDSDLSIKRTISPVYLNQFLKTT